MESGNLNETFSPFINMAENASFAPVFRTFYEPLCRFAQRYVGDMEIAADVIETLFVSLWERAEMFDDLSHARHFLYKAAHNACLNQLRSQKRSAIREDYFAREAGAFEEDYLHNMLREELLAAIHREIERLPLNYAKIIRLGYIDGLPNDEIAREMDLSVQTVKNYKVKAFSMLRKSLSYDAMLFLLTGKAVVEVFQ